MVSKLGMTIDVIVPIYNAEEYLVDCIKSLLIQSYSNVHIILIDDGSTDASGKICDRFANQYANISAYHQPNQGVSQARNRGISKSTSEYFTFVDVDDTVTNDYIEKAAAELTKNQSDILITSYVRRYPNKEIRTKVFGPDTILFNREQVRSLPLRHLFGPLNSELDHPLTVDNLSPVWSKFYRRECFMNIRFIDMNKIYSEDTWFNIQCFLKAKSCEYFPHINYIYSKENAESLVHQYNPNLVKEYQNLYSLMKKAILQYQLPDSYQESLRNRCAINLLTVLRNVCQSSLTLHQQVKIVDGILNSDYYRQTLKNFSLGRLPIIYRLFYKLCKGRYSIMTCLVLKWGEHIKTVIKQ